MTKTITLERNKSLRFYSTVLAGAVASFLTQPLEVIKTNRINSPATFYHDLHKTIIRSGWKTYMRGRYASIYAAPSPSSGRATALPSILSSSPPLRTQSPDPAPPSTSF
jgi:hypothetical protein